MRLFGLVITSRKAIMRERMANAATDAQQQLRTILQDAEHPLRKAIVRVARSAASDHFEQLREERRAEFEADPEFQEWARQRREHDLAEAEKAQPAELKPSQVFDFNESQLRYGILGMLVEHGMQVTATLADVFSDWTPAQLTHALSELVSAGLVEVKRGVYTATLAGVGLGSEEKEARDEDPDSQ